MPSLARTKHRPHAGAGVPWRKRTPKAGGRGYVYGSYIDEPLALITPTAKYYNHANHLYSVAALTDAAGSVVERYRYDTYGNRTVLASDGVTTRAVSSYNQQVGFTGRYLDKETSLWYFRARYYSGSLGRFIGRDPWRAPRSSYWRPRAGGGYHDGYSLYAAYMVPNFLDPKGTVCGTWSVLPKAGIEWGGMILDGFEVLFDSTGCTCKCGTIVQAIDPNGWLSTPPHIDTEDKKRAENNAELTAGRPPLAPPGYTEEGMSGATGADDSLVDSPGAQGPGGSNGIFEIEDCAYCVDKSGTRTLLGCVQYTWDSNTKKITKPAGGGAKIPSGPQGGLMTAAQKAWKIGR